MSELVIPYFSHEQSVNDIFFLFTKTVVEEFDFEAAEKMLGDLAKECESDLFLVNLKLRISKHCGYLVLSTKALISIDIDIDSLAKCGVAAEEFTQMIQETANMKTVKEGTGMRVENEGADLKQEIVRQT